MKFFLMRGNGDPDGSVSFNSDITYCNEDYSTEISEDVWCVRYNDEVAPVNVCETNSRSDCLSIYLR